MRLGLSGMATHGDASFDNEYGYTKDLFGEARGGTLIMERNNLILLALATKSTYLRTSDDGLPNPTNLPTYVASFPTRCSLVIIYSTSPFT